jgi:hypothetical protein
MTDTEKDLMTRQEVAQYLNVIPERVNRIENDGLIERAVRGVYTRDSVEAYKAKRGDKKAGRYKMKPEEKLESYVARKIEKLTPVDIGKLRKCAGRSVGDSPEIFELILDGMPRELWSKRDFDEDDPFTDRSSPAEQAVHTALTLYALASPVPETAPVKDGHKTLGRQLRAYIKKEGDDVKDTAYKRLRQLCKAGDYRRFAEAAAGIVKMLKTKGIYFYFPGFASDAYLFFGDDEERKAEVIARWTSQAGI